MKTKKYWILVVVGVCVIHHLTASVPAKVGVTVGPKVAADGTGTHRTIQEAVDAAAAGAVILVGPGVYEERVKIDKPLTLEGAGWEQTTIMTRNIAADKFQLALLAFSVRIGDRVKEVKTNEQRVAIMEEFVAEFSQKYATLLVTNTEGVLIRNLKISSPGQIMEGRSLPVPVIKFKNAKAEVVGCAVIGSAGEGIRVAGGSDVEIRNCLVAAVWNTGIVVAGDKSGIAKARIQDSDVRNCHYAGIVIRPGCDVVVKGCRISGSAWHGIRYDGASPAITGNLVFGNARSGIYASGKTAATVKNNVFYKNKMGGVSCWDNNRDSIENNTFASNGRDGLSIKGKCRTTIRRNIFFGHSKAVTFSSGAGVADGCRLERNLYWENEEAVVGAEVKPGTNNEIISVDPLFVDVSEKDFSLAKDSPALKKGIGVAVPIAFRSPWALQPEEKAIIPDGDTRDSRKWKKPAKIKPTKGKRVGPLGKGPPGDKDSDITGKEAQGFEQLLEEYKGLVSKLDARLTAYRASMPVFARFAEVYENKFFISLDVQVQAAGARLKEFREQGHNLESSKYNKNEEAKKVAVRIAGAIYRDVYSEFQKALEASQLKITDEQEEIYYNGCYFYFMTAEPASEPFEAHYPYKKDTVEYNLFLRDLGQLVRMAGSPLGKMVRQLPAKLEEEQRKVNELYEQLVQAKERSKADIPLPQKYKEPYLRSLEEKWQSIRQAAK